MKLRLMLSTSYNDHIENVLFAKVIGKRLLEDDLMMPINEITFNIITRLLWSDFKGPICYSYW
jgi:hypothetical protein